MTSGLPSTHLNVGGYSSPASEQIKWMYTFCQSQDGYDKIVRYNLKKLVRFTGIFTMFCDGTVLTAGTTVLINVVCAFILSTCTCWIMLLRSCMNPEFYKILQEQDTTPLKDLSMQINKLVIFCLPLYMSLSLARWWAVRERGLGRIFNALTGISMILSSELHDERWRAMRVHVIKMGLASIELLVQAAQNCEDIDNLVQLELLSLREAAAIKRVPMLWARPMTCWAWILGVCRSALNSLHGLEPRNAQILGQVKLAKQGIITINSYMDTQLPFAYVHMITLLVNVQNLVLALKSGILFAHAVAINDRGMMVQQLALVLVMPLVYQGLMQISCLIADPFGDEVTNFPMRSYIDYVNSILDATFEAQLSCPVVAENGMLYRPEKQ